MPTTDLHGASAVSRSGLLFAALAALAVHAGAAWLLTRDTTATAPRLAEIDLRFSAAPRPAPLPSPAEPAAPRPDPVPPRPTPRPSSPKPVAETPKTAEVADTAPVATPAATVSPEVASTPAAAPHADAGEQARHDAASNAPSAPIFDADYLQNPEPDYPPLSRRLREQGEVLLRVRVRADGTAADVELDTSSGFPRLDQSAIAAVKRWRFVPARLGNEAVEASVLVPVKFVYHRA